MSTDELVKLFSTRARRRFQRGLTRKPMALIKKLRKAKRAPAGDKPEPVRTHLRNMIIGPEMIGSIIGVYNGKTFNQVEIKPEMIGHYLAEFSISYKPVKHRRPGIGATHSSSGNPNIIRSVYTSFLHCLTNHTKLLPHQFSNTLFSQTNSSFSSLLQAYIRNAKFNTTSTPKPLLIITPQQQSHLQATILFAKSIGIQLKIRSGGHDFEGATVGELCYWIWEKSKVHGFPAGVCPTVAVGGHFTRGWDVLHKYANEDVSLGSWFIGLDVDQVDDRRMCCGAPPVTDS